MAIDINYDKRRKFDPASLVGRIVLEDACHHWAGVGRPILVESHSGTKLCGRRPDGISLDMKGDRRFNTEGRGFNYSRNLSHSEGAEYRMSRAVAAVCDTLEEAVSLMNLDVAASERFQALLKESRAQLLAMQTPPNATEP